MSIPGLGKLPIKVSEFQTEKLCPFLGNIIMAPVSPALQGTKLLRPTGFPHKPLLTLIIQKGNSRTCKSVYHPP